MHASMHARMLCLAGQLPRTGWNSAGSWVPTAAGFVKCALIWQKASCACMGTCMVWKANALEVMPTGARKTSKMDADDWKSGSRVVDKFVYLSKFCCFDWTYIYYISSVSGSGGMLPTQSGVAKRCKRCTKRRAPVAWFCEYTSFNIHFHKSYTCMFSNHIYLKG